MTNREAPEPARQRGQGLDAELTVRIQYVIVDGPDGAVLEQRQLRAIRRVLAEFAEQEGRHYDHENGNGE